MATAKRAQGAQSSLTMAFETDFGTTPSTGGVIMPIISSSLKASQNLNDSSVIRGTRNPAAPSRGNIDTSGSIVPPVDVLGFGYWLKLQQHKAPARNTYLKLVQICHLLPLNKVIRILVLTNNSVAYV